MAVTLSFIGGAGWQFFDNNGVPLAGGKIYTYAAGTTTPLTTYTARDGLTANTNPIILDSAGRTPSQIWSTEGVLYKYVVATVTDVILRTWDNIGGSVVSSDLAVNLANTSDNAKGDALVGFKQSSPSGFLTGATARTVNTKLQDFVSVKDFGAVGDGVTNDTAAIQAAVNYAGIVNNVNGAVPSVPTACVYLPRGTYRVQKIALSPGISFIGAGRDATILQVVAGLSDTIVEIKRPATILSSRTRNYLIEELTILGDGTIGQIGIDLYQVAEISIRNVNINGCEYGILGYDVVTGKIDRCKISGCTTRGIFLRDGCNGIELANTRLQTTLNGANIEIDGGLAPGGARAFLTFGVHLNNCIIESALSTTNGVGALIGAVNSVVNVVFSGCYFENNKTSAIDIGSPTSTGKSNVVVVGGNIAAVGVPAAFGIRNYGGSLAVLNAWIEGVPTVANRLVNEDVPGNAAVLWNMTGTTPTGAAGYAAVGRGFGFGPGNYFQANGIFFGASATDFGQFITRPSDIAFQANGKYLYVQSEFRTAYQGTALLSAGVYNVVFSTPAANASYAVTLGSEGNNHIKISGKTVAGFTISAVNGSGAVQTGDTSRVHWHVFRNL